MRSSYINGVEKVIIEDNMTNIAEKLEKIKVTDNNKFTVLKSNADYSSVDAVSKEVLTKPSQ